MKSYSIELSPDQLEEVRNLVFGIVAVTQVVHSLRYGEQYTFQKAAMKLVNKCQTMRFRKRNKRYKVSFVPMEGEIIAKVFSSVNPLKLNPYSQTVVTHFVGQIHQQGENLKLTFLSQFPKIE